MDSNGDYEMKKVYFFVSIIGILFGGLQNASAGKTNESQNYQCKHEADGRVFCLDEKGKPLTGKKTRGTDGRYISIESYAKGYRDGLTTFFDEDGKQHERVYFKQGLKNGMDKIYYATGGVKINAQYKNGVLHGQVEAYNDRGKLLGRMRYKNGMLERGFCKNEDGKNENFTPQFIAAQPQNQIVTCGAQ